MTALYAALGGRKQFNGLFAVLILSAYGFTRDVAFLEWAGMILMALGVTNATHAAVDREKVKAQGAEAALEGAERLEAAMGEIRGREARTYEPRQGRDL